MIPDLLLAEFNQFLAAHTGLYFASKEQKKQLLKGMEKAAGEFGFKDPAKCIQWLMAAHLSKEQIEILASHLTVGETYFFREQKSFEILETKILPELIRSRDTGETNGRRLRIWSAACSSGEEAYSIAVLLDKMKEQLKDFNILILATDINRKALSRAGQGIYNEWSFRAAPGWIKDRYFSRERQDQYKIRPQIRDMVAFDYLNLVEDACPSLLNNTNGMNIIFCRNVLMYFSRETAQKVVKNLSRCLVIGGWLIVSPTDAFHISDPGLLRVDIPGAPVYQKVPVPAASKSITVPAAAVEPFQPLPPVPTPQHRRIEQPISGKEEIKKPVKSGYEKAFQLYRQGFYMEAIRLLKSLLRNPASAPLINGNYSEDNLYELLARCHANLGKLEKAEKWCRNAIETAKLKPQYRFLLASIQLEQGKTGEAVVSLKQSLYLNQDYIPAYFTLGHIALQKQNYADANRYFDNTLSLLAGIDANEPVMEMEEGLTAGRMKEIIKIMKEKE